MARVALLFALIGLIGLRAAAQDDLPLRADQVDVVEGIGLFDLPTQTAEGMIINAGERAYTNISVYAAAYDRAGTLIAEGYGVLVNACGAGLLDAVLLPGESARFSAPLERIESAGAIAAVEIEIDARQTADLPTPTADLVPGLTKLFAGEAVAVEFWESGMVFAAGCIRSPFYTWSWYRYDAVDDDYAAIEHPHAQTMQTDRASLQQRLLLRDDLAWDNAFFRFVPDGTRFTYQDQINTFYTAALPGRAIRPLHARLANRSLQGVYWLPEGRFLAYYYGAYGDLVNYFTADADGRYISASPTRMPASQTVPGVSADGRRVVITGDYGQGFGYHLLVVTNGYFEKLFELDAPGSNYPQPLLITEPDDNLVTHIYFAHEVDGEARLTCFNRERETLSAMGALPIRLAEDERASFYLTPDETRFILAANGQHGGIWAIDRAALPPC